MKLIAEYLERAQQFEKLAAEAADDKFKEDLLAQALAYRKLAQRRAETLHIPFPSPPENPD